MQANPEVSGDGVLVLEALHEQRRRCNNGRGVADSFRDVTSVRLKTQSKRSFMWGGTLEEPLPVYLEARIKTPSSELPAFLLFLYFTAGIKV